MIEPTQQYQDLYKAQETLGDLVSQISTLIPKLRNAIARVIQEEARIAGPDAKDALIDMANANRATWSGGTSSTSNLIETIKREEALYYLVYKLSHDKP